MKDTKLELTADNYFSAEAERLFFGSSSFKAYDMENKTFEVFGNSVEGGCEAREVAVADGLWEKEEKEAFIVGSYVHAAMESKEAFQKLIDDNYYDIYQKSGKKLRSAFEQADKMIETLKNSEIVQDMMDCQHEVIFTGEIAGVPIKIMCDLLDLERGYIADYKTTKKVFAKSYKNGKWVSLIDMFDYKMQVALYSEIIRQNVGKWLDFYYILVDKQKQPDHAVVYMGSGEDPNSFIHEKLDEAVIKLPRMYLVKTRKEEPRRCGDCAYCRSTKKVLKPISLEEFEEMLR